MPPWDPASLYSPPSSAGANPDCSGIQPLGSHHAAQSHECRRKRANTECGSSCNVTRGTRTHTHAAAPTPTEGLGKLLEGGGARESSLGAATWGTLPPEDGGRAVTLEQQMAHSMTETPSWRQPLPVSSSHSLDLRIHRAAGPLFQPSQDL